MYKISYSKRTRDMMVPTLTEKYKFHILKENVVQEHVYMYVIKISNIKL